jgi:hypothetical protein
MVTLSTASAVPTVEHQQNLGGRKEVSLQEYLAASASFALREEESARRRPGEGDCDRRQDKSLSEKDELGRRERRRGECTHRRIVCDRDLGERNTHVDLRKDESEGEISGLSARACHLSKSSAFRAKGLLVRSCFEKIVRAGGTGKATRTQRPTSATESQDSATTERNSHLSGGALC